jgi:CMD domain protein
MNQPPIIEKLVAAPPGSALAAAMTQRAEILRLSQASHDAVVTPVEPGGFSHGERAALAQRMARLSGDTELAAHYGACLEAANGDAALRRAADPTLPIEAQQRLAAVIGHVDLLTQRPRDATRADIDALKNAGVDEPDIVRLAELAAFVNYQLRVVAGLKLLRDL